MSKSRPCLSDMTEPELTALFRNVGFALNHLLPLRRDGGKTLFILLATDDAEKSGIAQYVSNARREDCIRWLRETADRLEGRDDVPR